MVITIDLGMKMFVHTVVLVQDLYNGEARSHTNTNQYVQNVDFYVGKDSDYTSNKVCPGGPYMVVDDYAKSYKLVPNLG